MKNIKKLLAAVLSSAMLLSVVSTSALAADVPPCEIEKEVSFDGYSFTITEKTYPDYSVSRTYTRDSGMTRSTPNIHETKAMLLAMGMDEDEVAAIPNETLQDFATSEEITIVTSYSKHSESSDQTTGLPEQTALAEAAVLSQEQEAYTVEHSQNCIDPLGEKPNNSSVPGIFEDSYMKITHSAIKLSGDRGGYKFTTNATWLTMPYFRGYDSIGSCAMNGTVTPNTSSGKYWYTTKTYNSGHVTSVNSGDITITDKYNEVNGNWYGSAGVFNLPDDPGGAPGFSVMHTDLKAYYEYKGHVSHPSTESYFNTIGTYSHATLRFGGSPSVSIDTSGNVSASIGLDITPSADVRNAEREIHYIP